MDRKSIIIIVVSILALFALPRVVNRFFPPVPAPVAEEVTNTATNGIVIPQAQTPGAVASKPSPASYGPEQTMSVTNDYLILTFTSRGGGLKDIAMRDYPAVTERVTNANTRLAALNERAPRPVLAVIGAGLETGGDFNLTHSGNNIVAEKTFANGLRVVKEFEPSTNYLFTGHVRFENTTAKPIPLPSRSIVVGTATAAGPMDDPTVMGAMWYNGVKLQNIQAKWFANRTLGCIPGTPRTQYLGGDRDVVWAASDNQFFALAAIPKKPAPGIQIDQIEVRPPALEGPTNSMSAYLTNGYQTALLYSPEVLPAHGKVEASFTFYAGPKEYNRLAQIASRMGNNLDLVMNFYPPFGFFAKLLLLLLKALHSLGLAYGLAIIVITVAIKVVFWPLTNASTKSQKRLQALQPQIQQIAEKYKDDPMKKNQKTMEFMKEHKVNPMGSCLPTLLQLPVLWGFYMMLRTAIELRGAHFLWAYDLSQPDTVFHLGTFPVNPLPLMMGAVQFWQAHMMPPSPGMDPGQQKIMRYMPLMFIAFFYRMSAGLNLYWTVQTLLSIVQIRLTNAQEPPARAAAAASAPVRKKK